MSSVALGSRRRAVTPLLRLARYLLEKERHQPTIDSETLRYVGMRRAQRSGIELREPGTDRNLKLAVALGGDGAFISHAARYAAHSVPVVGVNLGRIGFLADISRNKMEEMISAVLAGKFNDEKRLMLDVAHWREGKVISKHTVINDIVIDRGPRGNLIELDVEINFDRSIHIRGDGLLFATPGGSTAYNLAAGGPIIIPDAGCIAMTPLNPYSLSQKPLVFSPKHHFSVKLASNSARLLPDGQDGSELKLGDEVMVTVNRRKLILRHPEDYNYFDMLRNKLYWRHE